MQLWMNIVLVVQLLSAMAMIGLVLIQHGKGADMGASFGSGASGSLFGATGSSNALSKATAVCATLFFVCTLGLALMANSGDRAAASSGSSLLERAAPAGPTASGVGAAIPAGAASATVTLPAAAASAVPAIPTK